MYMYIRGMKVESKMSIGRRGLMEKEGNKGGHGV